MTATSRLDKQTAEYWADWLVDAVAMATQNRMFLSGEPEADEAAIEAIRINAIKALKSYNASPPSRPQEREQE